MMFPVTYFTSDYQSWGQFLLESYLNQRIDLADRIYFSCLCYINPVKVLFSLYDDRL
jgi:hypothetical protein